MNGRETFGLWLDVTLSNEGPGAASRLAKAIGVSDGAITQWRGPNGRQPVPENITKIAEFYGLDPIRLLVTAGHLDGGIGDPYEIPEHKRAETEMRKALEKDGVMTKEDVAATLEYARELRRKRTNGHTQ